ncbi:MAG: class 1 fructose-bisphosphatase [Saprospiraceae bacterium]|nr:class 1 fructose-bisphosphatase [Saprospiraceae bacterium]
MDRRITLDEFIISNQHLNQNASGEFSGLLRHLGIASKIINRVVNKAGLLDILGLDGGINSTGDSVQKLDTYANELMIEYLKNSGICAGVASEENDEFIDFTIDSNIKSSYVVVFDPLDGSSNIDVNISVGTIFGIYKRLSHVDRPLDLHDFCQQGNKLVAAGYVLHGTSTMLVYTTGGPVNGFTYDRGIGEFCLSHPEMKIPEKGKYYSINQGYSNSFSEGINEYLKHMASNNTALRYIGSMVADVHRTLCLGGIFIYPGTLKSPEGKLRILYECNPLSMIIEKAGGKSINEKNQRILDSEVFNLHQKSSIIIGSKLDVDEVLLFI